MWKPPFYFNSVVLHVSGVFVLLPAYERLYKWKPFLGTNLLEDSIGRDLGALKRSRLASRGVKGNG